MNTFKNRGPIFVFCAAFLWSFAGILSKFIPWSGMSIACIRGIIAAITIGFVTKKWFFKPTLAVWLGAFGTFGTSILFMIANKITTAANAIVLQYTAPAFVILFSVLILKEKPAKLDVITIAVMLTGISLFFIDHLGNGKILGDILSITAGITFGLVFFANRMPGANAMQASYLGCLLHGLLIPFLFTDSSFKSMDPTACILMVIMGVFQMGLAYTLFSKGVKTTSPVSASIIAMVEPILNPIWVFLFMHERPSVMAVSGAAIVIVTVCIYNAVSAMNKSKAPETVDSSQPELQPEN